MQTGNNKPRKNHIFHRQVDKSTIIIPVIIYLLLYYCTSTSSNSDIIIKIGRDSVPISALTGAFSLLSSLCLLVMVLLYKKLGFIISLIATLPQVPILISVVILRHNPTAILGILTNIITIVMLVIIILYQSQNEKEQLRLQNLFEQTATSLVNAIDAKDTYSHGHSIRVAEYSEKIARMIGKNEAECREIYYAALLHDVGKLGVDEGILDKKGKLTSEEYEAIKQHPVIVYRILSSIGEFPYLSIGAHYHHERYDGKGYPDGLKGEEIPEIARIISVADAYDAMSSNRCYRDAIPQQLIRAEIVKGAGTQFDPKLAGVMQHLIDKDTDYRMREESAPSRIPDGISTTPFMTKIRFKMTHKDNSDNTPSAKLILFDSLDGRVHENEKSV